jgi:hypothetical protein
MLRASFSGGAAMEHTALLVEPGPWSGWLVRREDRGDGIPFSTRATAVEYARSMAEALSPARVRVRNRNGGTDLDWWARGEGGRRVAA